MGEMGGDPDLLQKALRSDGLGQLRLEDLHRHLTVMLQVLGQVYDRHPPAAQLSLELIPAAHGGL